MDKISIETNSITKVVATDNWIIKITAYKLYFAHQSDTALIVNKTDTHALSPSTRGEVQYVNIEVSVIGKIFYYKFMLLYVIKFISFKG